MAERSEPAAMPLTLLPEGARGHVTHLDQVESQATAHLIALGVLPGAELTLVQRYPGVYEAVQSLKTLGKRLGVVTSKMREGTLHGLSSCGLAGLFDTVVAADDVDRHKPDPTPVLKALRRQGLQVVAIHHHMTGARPVVIRSGRGVSDSIVGRIAGVGGSVDIQSSGQGTMIVIRVPAGGPS